MKTKASEYLEFWNSRRGTIRSRKGGWKIGQGVFSHGYNMMEELVGKKTYFQVMVLHATGKMVDRAFADQIEAVFICLSWPDPRIWCNQIGALGGSMRSSVVSATAAGIMAGDSKLYGQKPLLEGLAFIQQALTLHRQGRSAEDIVAAECKKHRGKPFVMGYARPIAKGDERVAAMERFARDSGCQIGEHQQLAYEIDKVMTDRYGESMNINGYASAVLSDRGFTPREAYQLSAILIASGVTACYVDMLEREPETFLPLRCDDIAYQGISPRPVPEKKGSDQPD